MTGVQTCALPIYVGTSEEDVWIVGGNYVWPTSAMQMEVVSSSVEDDPVKADTNVGTGVHSVIIYDLNGSGVSATETVSLNGTAAVATTATNIYRVQGFRAVTTGTGLAAAGNIDLRNIADTPIYSRIATGYTRARNITYTVPTGYNLYVTSSTIGVYGATKGIRVTARSTWDSDAAAQRDFFIANSEYVMGNGIIYRPFEVPTRLPAGTRLKTSVIADAAGAVVSVAHRGWLETA